MFDVIIAAVKNIIKNFIIAICDFLDPLLLPIAEALPTLEWNVSFLEFLSFANLFFDFKYAFVLFFAYVLFALTINIINWILGLIPTIN